MVSDKVAVAASEQLRDYEMVFVIRPELIGEELEAVIANISRFITERGGDIAEMQRWGKRRLAYPIKHCLEGNYVLARFKLKAELAKELEANLKISEAVLRHLLVKLAG